MNTAKFYPRPKEWDYVYRNRLRERGFIPAYTGIIRVLGSEDEGVLVRRRPNGEGLGLPVFNMWQREHLKGQDILKFFGEKFLEKWGLSVDSLTELPRISSASPVYPLDARPVMNKPDLRQRMYVPVAGLTEEVPQGEAEDGSRLQALPKEEVVVLINARIERGDLTDTKEHMMLAQLAMLDMVPPVEELIPPVG